MNTQIRHLSTTRLLSGGALIAAGAMLALQAVGLLHFLDLVRGWPLFVIVLAFVKIGATLRDRHVQGWGLLLAGFGLATIIRGLRDHSGNSDENRYAIQ
jgi:hypothetical protein